MISTAGGIYAVPALRLASQRRSAVAASPRIPNVIPQAVPDETEMVADLDRRLGAHAAGYSRYSCNPSVRNSTMWL